MRIARVILAAGQSSRFNGCKLIADVGNAQPMIARAVDTLKSDDALPTYIISGVWHSEITHVLADYKNIKIIHNPKWQEGLGKSIAVATQLITNTQPVDGILFMLADQVELKSEHINTLLNAFVNKPTRWCADYGERKGVPAIFPAADFKLLKALSCDKGAQHLLRHTDAEVNTIKLSDARIDIDTQQQLKQFIQSKNALACNK